MNDVLTTIQTRFSCRNYDGRPVEQEKVEALVKAALQAPSAMNIQPWKIIAITNKDLVDELDAAAMEIIATDPDQTRFNRIKDRGGKVFYNAPCMFLILKDPKAKWADLDCGIVTQNISLAATSLGLDNVIVAMAAIPFTPPGCCEFKKRVDFPFGYEFGMGVLVGYGIDKKEPHEIDMDKVTYIN
ncbi:MAG: nitroreductase family protein [Defluviitaleaceae bacterium]|nr:nitroreductase family protein [Defluviitaleaceae bacterium]